MLRLLRVRAWCLATALSLAAGTAGASFEALLHGGDVHDPCCPPVVRHDETAHRYRAADAPVQAPDGHHCLACHWARWFRLDGVATAVAARLDDAGAHAPLQTIGRILPAAPTGLPARSPPLFS